MIKIADAFHHAKSSVKKWGGVPEDYLPVHNWFDESKRYFADPRHRAIRHHSQGIGWAIDFFGPMIKLSTCAKCGKAREDHVTDVKVGRFRLRTTKIERALGLHDFIAKEIPTRWIGEQHCNEDFGRIPTMEEWLSEMTVQPWMVRGARKLSRELEV